MHYIGIQYTRDPLSGRGRCDASTCKQQLVTALRTRTIQFNCHFLYDLRSIRIQTGTRTQYHLPAGCCFFCSSSLHLHRSFSRVSHSLKNFLRLPQRCVQFYFVFSYSLHYDDDEIFGIMCKILWLTRLRDLMVDVFTRLMPQASACFTMEIEWKKNFLQQNVLGWKKNSRKIVRIQEIVWEKVFQGHTLHVPLSQREWEMKKTSNSLGEHLVL